MKFVKQGDVIICLQACVRLMPSTMLYSGRSADETHLIVSTVITIEMIFVVLINVIIIVFAHCSIIVIVSGSRCASVRH